MKDRFNAHYEWLGIPLSEQPAHHYRLLGIELFEQNRDVIQKAADRQSLHLKTFQSGPRSAFSQKLLNEVSVAAGCLLVPKSKAAYDAQLAVTLQANEPSKPDAAPISLELNFANPTTGGSKQRSTHPRASQSARPISEIVKVVLGGASGLFLAVLVLSYFAGIDPLGWSKKAREEQVKAMAKNRVEDSSKPPAKPVPAYKKNASADTGASNSAHPVDPEAAASNPDVNAVQPAPAARLHPAGFTSRAAPPVASLSSVLGDPSSWRFRDSSEPVMGPQGLEIRADEKPNFMVTKRADYRNVIVTIELAAGKGADAYLIIGAQQANDVWTGITSHIYDDGASILSGHQFQNFDPIEKGLGRENTPYDVPQTIELRMNNNDCWIKVDEVARSGVLYGRGRLENRIGAVGLIVNSGSVTISRVEIISLAEPGLVDGNGELESPSADTASGHQPSQISPPYITGDWRIDAGELVTEGSSQEKQFFFLFGDPQWHDYDLSVEVIDHLTSDGGPKSMENAIIFRSDEKATKYWKLDLGAFRGAKNLDLLAFAPGQDAWKHPARRWLENRLHGKAGTWYSVKVQVRGPKVTVAIDGVEVASSEHPELLQGRVGACSYGAGLARWRKFEVRAPDGTLLWSGLPSILADNLESQGDDKKAIDAEASDRKGDPTAAALQAAKKDFQDALDRSHDKLVQAFDEQIDKLKSNKKMSLEQLLAEMEILQLERGEFIADKKHLPTSKGLQIALGEYRRAVLAARKKCESALENAAAEYRKQMDLESAKSVVRELDQFRQSNEYLDAHAQRDRFIVGVMWSGLKIFRDGTRRSTTLEISERRGNDCKGMLTIHNNGTNVVRFEARVEQDEIVFRFPAGGGQPTSMTGRIAGDTLVIVESGSSYGQRFELSKTLNRK
jgi:hypothetical protein